MRTPKIDISCKTRRLGAGLFLLLAAAISPRAMAAPPGPAPWGDVSTWAGKNPTDQTTKPPKRLLAIPSIQAEIHRLLSATDRGRLAALVVEKPVLVRNNFVLVAKCMAHDCGGQNAMVVIDPRLARIWVGFFFRADNLVSTRWFGTTDSLVLPESVMTAFAAMHQP